MKLKNKYYFFLLFLLISFTSIGQTDSSSKLSITIFLQLVKENHPLAKQAGLVIKAADANTLTARGSFDPKVFYEFRNKYFDGKNYYEMGNGGFKIPTWYGIEIKGGVERNYGAFLNPVDNLSNQELAFAQVSVPLLQGLMIDERRAVLKQAKIFKELSEYDKINMINDLLYKAGKIYWDWHLSFNNLQIHRNAVDISEDRFEAIKRSTEFGDRPAIDTVEANIQLQDRIINLQQALMDYRTKSLLLSNYLWLENDIPVEITDKTIPETYDILYNNESYINSNTNQIDSLINLHPNIKMYDFKLQQLAVEQRFKQDKLKPSLDVLFNPLFNTNNLAAGYQNNYKWGVTVGFPVLLRKERGELQLTKIKIKNTAYEPINKRNELVNKTKATINEYKNYKNQITIYSKNVVNHEQLWQSEKRLFGSGESSLFMINSREMNYINAQIKLNEIINKNKKAALDVEYSLGLLNVIY